MRLLLIADVHGRLSTLSRTLQRIKETDYVLVAGDITSYAGTHWADVMKLLHRWCKDSGCKAFLVPGNVDVRAMASLSSEVVKVLHVATDHMPPYIIGGIGGGLGFEFWGISKMEDTHMTLLVRDFIMKYGPGLAPLRWVLLTHTPPYGTKLDILYTGEHVGSRAIRALIEERKPLLAVSGHIHESRNVDSLGRTTLVNPGPNYKGYFAVAEIDSEGGWVDVTLNKL